MTRLDRRALLRGAGATIALPFLDAMRPRRAHAQDAPPLRFFTYYVPNGIHMADWTPTTEGAGFELPWILEPLAAHADQLLVLTGLANRAAIGGAGDHARGTGSFLTCMPVSKTSNEGLTNGISADQVAARALPFETKLRSLQVGLEGGVSVGNCDSGYSCAYSRNISWSTPSTPMPKITRAAQLFDQLFAAGASGAQAERRRRQRRSVLDYVADEATRLASKLGAADNAKLDEYLTGVRELELKIDNEGGATVCQSDLPEAGGDLPARARIMADLMVKAMACDLTRIITFMFGNAQTNRAFDFMGIQGAHHELSHHQHNPEKLEKLRRISRFEVEQLAYLLDAMAAVDDGDGTLLDNSAVLFSSEIEDGDTHAHVNLPVLLAGRCGGAFTPGRHLKYTDDEPVANLYLSILNAIGVPSSSFGLDGTRPLPNLRSS